MFTVIDVRKQLGLSVGGVSDRQLSTGWWWIERAGEAIDLEAGCHCLVRVLIITLGWSSVPHQGHSGVKMGSVRKNPLEVFSFKEGGVRKQVQCLLCWGEGAMILGP